MYNKEYQGEIYKNEVTLQPTSYEQMQQFITTYGQCRFVSGGSDVMVDFKFSNKMPRYVISLTRLQMHDYLQLENGILKLGALVTLHELEEFLAINDKKASAFF